MIPKHSFLTIVFRYISIYKALVSYSILFFSFCWIEPIAIRFHHNIFLNAILIYIIIYIIDILLYLRYTMSLDYYHLLDANIKKEIVD